jgi:hypothetical protein
VFDGDRRITLQEFSENKEMIEKWVGAIESASATFDEIDSDGGGMILFDEFCSWAIKKNLDLEDDVDGNWEDEFQSEALKKTPVKVRESPTRAWASTCFDLKPAFRDFKNLKNPPPDHVAAMHILCQLIGCWPASVKKGQEWSAIVKLCDPASLSQRCMDVKLEDISYELATKLGKHEILIEALSDKQWRPKTKSALSKVLAYVVRTIEEVQLWNEAPDRKQEIEDRRNADIEAYKDKIKKRDSTSRAQYDKNGKRIVNGDTSHDQSIQEVEPDTQIYTFSTSDISELKAFGAPPQPVKELLDVLTKLLGVEKEYPTRGSHKKLLGSSNLGRMCFGLSMSDIPLERVEEIEKSKVVKNGVPTMKKVSAASAQLLGWVKTTTEDARAWHAGGEEERKEIEARRKEAAEKQEAQTPMKTRPKTAPSKAATAKKEAGSARPASARPTSAKPSAKNNKPTGLSKADCDELKSVSRPSELVIELMKIVAKVHGHTEGQQDWKGCKKMLAESTFLSKCAIIDVSKISLETVTELESSSIFTEGIDKIANASKSASGFYVWVEQTLASAKEWHEHPEKRDEIEQKRKAAEAKHSVPKKPATPSRPKTASSVSKTRPASAKPSPAVQDPTPGGRFVLNAKTFKTDLQMLKGLNNPPQPLKDLMDAVAKLLGNDEKDWKEQRKLMGSSSFVKSCFELQLADISSDTITAVEGMGVLGDAERVRSCAAAAMQLYRWTEQVVSDAKDWLENDEKREDLQNQRNSEADSQKKKSSVSGETSERPKTAGARPTTARATSARSIGDSAAKNRESGWK